MLKTPSKTLSIDDLRHSSTSVLFLLLVRGSSAPSDSGHFLTADRNVRIIGWGYTELYRVVHRALSAIRNNGVSTFQGEVYTGIIGPMVGTLENVRIIEVSARRGSTVYVKLLHSRCIGNYNAYSIEKGFALFLHALLHFDEVGIRVTN